MFISIGLASGIRFHRVPMAGLARAHRPQTNQTSDYIPVREVADQVKNQKARCHSSALQSLAQG